MILLNRSSVKIFCRRMRSTAPMILPAVLEVLVIEDTMSPSTWSFKQGVHPQSLRTVGYWNHCKIYFQRELFRDSWRLQSVRSSISMHICWAEVGETSSLGCLPPSHWGGCLNMDMDVLTNWSSLCEVARQLWKFIFQWCQAKTLYPVWFFICCEGSYVVE